MNSSSVSSGAAALPWWKAWLAVSLLQFASGDLEGLYEQYLTSSVSPWTLAHSAHALVGWTMFAHKLVTTPPELREHLPAAWPIGFLVPVMMGIFLSIIFIKPEFYAKHRRALHTGMLCGIVLTLSVAQRVLLWMRLFNNNRTGMTSWVQLLQSFTTENLYFTLMWIVVVAFPAGQAPCIAIVTAGLLSDMARNTTVCNLPMLGDSTITMSPRLLAWTHTASFWVSLFGPPYPLVKVADKAASLPCSAVLAFWQVVGWWLACHAVVAADILRRRAFLQSHAALAHLGPAYQAAAKHWPFGSGSKTATIIVMSLALTYYSAFMWSIALQAFTAVHT